MENNKKPIKIWNKTSLDFCTIGTIIQQLNVYKLDEDGKKLELGAFYLGDLSPQYRYSVEIKQRHINVYFWVEDSRVYNAEVQENE